VIAEEGRDGVHKRFKGDDQGYIVGGGIGSATGISVQEGSSRLLVMAAGGAP
jgi:hypothetical protein